MRIKPLFVIAFALFLKGLYGQTTETIIQGSVKGLSDDFNPFSYSGIMYTEYKKKTVHSATLVDSAGHFRIALPKLIKIDLNTFYENYYDADTTLNTGSHDTITLNFTLRPKKYIFHEAQAKQDIENGLIQLLIYDSLIFNWNQKINYTAKLGFNYSLIDKPKDFEFERNIENYNWTVQEFLNSKDSMWHMAIDHIEDSLINLEADNFGRQNKIDLNRLAFSKEILSPEMIEGIKEKKSELKRIFRKESSEILKYSVNFILDKIDNDPNYHFVFLTEYWLAFHYEEMIPELIKRITNGKEVGLTNTADLIIWERIQSGDLKFYGHGGVAQDDLFKVAGRANHLLKRITNEDFSPVLMKSGDRDLLKIQNRWAYWLIKSH